VITVKPVSQAAEVAAAPSASGGRTYYVSGAEGASFGGGQQSGNFQGWVHKFSPAKVGAASSSLAVDTISVGQPTAQPTGN
jgi:hypothetical protein